MADAVGGGDAPGRGGPGTHGIAAASQGQSEREDPAGSGNAVTEHRGHRTGSAPIGGAPLLGADDCGVPERVACPFCEREETELHSAFGGQLSTSTYWCRSCRTAFEWFKWNVG